MRQNREFPLHARERRRRSSPFPCRYSAAPAARADLRAFARGRRRQNQQQRQRQQPRQLHARPPQNHQRHRAAEHREHERQSVHADDTAPGASARGISIPAFPSCSQAKPSARACARCRSTARPPPAWPTICASEIRRSAAKTRHVQALEHAEQRERGPSAPAAQPAVDFEHELDPVADAEPEHESRGPAVQESPLPGRFARAGEQQGRQRDRRQPRQIEARKIEGSAEPPEQREREIHAGRPARSPRSAM